MIIRVNWGVGVGLVYSAFAAGTIGMVLIASSTPVDLVSPDYYARSLAVDRHLAAVENGRAADVRVSIDRRDGETALQITWPADIRRGAEGTLTLYRPSASSSDRTIAIVAGDAQSVPLTDVPPGQWQAQLQWTSEGREYYVEREIVTP